MNELMNFTKNVTSQNGEDGVIEEIFNRIKPKYKIAVEFGAWDGINYSNTYNLWANNNWKAILIEGDQNKFKLLTENIRQYSNVLGLNLWVDSKNNKLDHILYENNIPFDFDLLSIDIDGDDYYIFQSLEKYHPTLIIIEFNFTIPYQYELVQKEGEYFGASYLAMNKLAESKGYKLCAITGGNLFFIRNDKFELLGIEEIDIAKIFPYQFLTNVISAYDGRLFITQKPIFKHSLSNKPQYLYREKTIIKIGNFEIILKIKRKHNANPIIGQDIIPVEIIT